MEKTHSPLILLNPGPVNLTPRVRNALLSPDICHREAEFRDLQKDIRIGLLEVYGSHTGYASIVLTGSGTASVEAMVTSLVPYSGKLLVLANGVYGERIQKIAQSHRIAHSVLRNEWGEEFDRAKIERILQQDKDITTVATVHHETTTGRLNDLSSVGLLCRQYGKALLVDAVSSFGAEEIKFDKWGITACAASSNKCLHGVAGASFVVANLTYLLSQHIVPPRSVYLDLSEYYREQEKGTSPFTHAVQVFYALSEALAELKEMGGWTARKRDYECLVLMIRQSAAKSGLSQYLTEGPLACSLTSFYLPSGTSYDELHDSLRASGFVIYAGQGKISKKIFRIANMGALNKEDIDRFNVTLKEILCKQ